MIYYNLEKVSKLRTVTSSKTDHWRTKKPRNKQHSSTVHNRMRNRRAPEEHPSSKQTVAPLERSAMRIVERRTHEAKRLVFLRRHCRWSSLQRLIATTMAIASRRFAACLPALDYALHESLLNHLQWGSRGIRLANCVPTALFAWACPTSEIGCAMRGDAALNAAATANWKFAVEGHH
jgi:hypothetical protein